MSPRASDELYEAARITRDAEALASGDPKRIARRVRNRILGHFVWRLLGWLFR